MYDHLGKQNPKKKRDSVFFYSNIIVFGALMQDKVSCHLILEVRPSHTAQAWLISEVKNVTLCRRAWTKKSVCKQQYHSTQNTECDLAPSPH